MQMTRISPISRPGGEGKERLSLGKRGRECMKIYVKIYATLRQYIPNAAELMREEGWDVADSSTMGAVMQTLKLPESLRILALINGAHCNDKATPLKDGDTLLLSLDVRGMKEREKAMSRERGTLPLRGIGFPCREVSANWGLIRPGIGWTTAWRKCSSPMDKSPMGTRDAL